ncbi:MAG: hypothetical protein AAGI23_04950 [Bacteroidota bacterium]
MTNANINNGDNLASTTHFKHFVLLSVATAMTFVAFLYLIDADPVDWSAFWSSREYFVGLSAMAYFLLLQMIVRHLFLRHQSLTRQLVISISVSGLIFVLSFIILGIFILQTI